MHSARLCVTGQHKILSEMHGNRTILCLAAVGSGQECRGVLVFQCGAVDANDKLQQVDVADQKSNRLVLLFLRPHPYCVGLNKQFDFECNNQKLQEEVSTARNCSGGPPLKIAAGREEGEEEGVSC